MWDCVLVFEIKGKLSLHQMEFLGTIGLLEHQIILLKLPTQTVPTLQWVRLEPSLPQRTEPLGLPGLLGQWECSMELPTETVPLW